MRTQKCTAFHRQIEEIVLTFGVMPRDARACLYAFAQGQFDMRKLDRQFHMPCQFRQAVLCCIGTKFHQ